MAFYAVREHAPLSIWNRVLFELAHHTRGVAQDKDLHHTSARSLRVHLGIMLNFYDKLCRRFAPNVATYACMLHALEPHVISHASRFYQYSVSMRQYLKEHPEASIAPKRLAFAYGLSAKALSYEYRPKENTTELFDKEFPDLLKEYFAHGGQPNNLIYTYLIEACGRAKSLNGLHLVFGSMREHNQSMDADVCIEAMAALGKIGARCHTEAVQMFNSLQGVVWSNDTMLKIMTSLGASYASVGDMETLKELATEVLPNRYGISPDTAFFTIVLSAAAKNKELFASILELMDSLDIEKDRTLLLRIANIAALHSNPDLVVSTLATMTDQGYNMSRYEVRALFNSSKVSGCYPLIRNMHHLMRTMHIPLLGVEWNWLMGLMAAEYDVMRLRKFYQAFIKLYRAKKYPDYRPPSFTTYKAMLKTFYDVADPHLVMKLFWDMRWLHPTGRIFNEVLARVLSMSYLSRVRHDRFNSPEDNAVLARLVGTDETHPQNPLGRLFSSDEYRAMAALQEAPAKTEKAKRLASRMPFLAMKPEEAAYVPVFRILRLLADLERFPQHYDIQAYHMLQLLPAYAVSKHFGVNPGLVDGIERLSRRLDFQSLSHAVETAVRTNQRPRFEAAVAMQRPRYEQEMEAEEKAEDRAERSREEAVMDRVSQGAEQQASKGRMSRRERQGRREEGEEEELDENMDEDTLWKELEQEETREK